MDTTNTTNSNDDQELAKVLEGMNQQVAGSTPVPVDGTAAAPVDGMAFEETPANSSATTVSSENSEDNFAGNDPLPATDSTAEPAVEPSYDPLASVAPEPVVAPGFGDSPELESMKKSALEDLRPLVEKLDLPADEKFDTLLLLIRSTDDKSLLGAAHEAARSIADETKRAQALLDVIKEIDYFSGHGPQPV